MKKFLFTIAVFAIFFIPKTSFAFLIYNQPNRSFSSTTPEAGFAQFSQPLGDLRGIITTDDPLYISVLLKAPNDIPSGHWDADTQIYIQCGPYQLQTYFLTASDISNLQSGQWINIFGATNFNSTATANLYLCATESEWYLSFYKFKSGIDGDYGYIATNALDEPFGQISYDPNDIDIVNTQTEFTFMDPADGEEVATSTDFDLYADLYLAEEDYQDGLYVRLSYVRQQNLQSAVANQELLWTTLDLDQIITSGWNFFSTTTSATQEGVYLYKAELRKQLNWWETAISFFNPFNSLDPDIIISTSTTFVYGGMTGFDRFIASTTQNMNDFTASTTLNFEQVSNDCNPLSFSLSGCFGALFSWQGPQMYIAIENMKNDMLSYAPFGYITRFFDIANDTATTSLPALTYTFGTNSALSGETITFDPWQYVSFTATGTPLHDIVSDQPEPKNVWQILEPFYRTTIYILLAILILGDIMGVAVGEVSDYKSRNRGEGSKNNKNPSKYREWLYKNRK